MNVKKGKKSRNSNMESKQMIIRQKKHYLAPETDH